MNEDNEKRNGGRREEEEEGNKGRNERGEGKIR